jgi:hypothetical protein
MGDLRDPRLMYLKAIMFVSIGALASMMLILENPRVRTVALLALAIWAFARAYYFAFYVIEHYVDADYKFVGLWSFLVYLVKRRK